MEYSFGFWNPLGRFLHHFGDIKPFVSLNPYPICFETEKYDKKRHKSIDKPHFCKHLDSLSTLWTHPNFLKNR